MTSKRNKKIYKRLVREVHEHGTWVTPRSFDAVGDILAAGWPHSVMQAAMRLPLAHRIQLARDLFESGTPNEVGPDLKAALDPTANLVTKDDVEPTDPYIVVIGNIVEGFAFHGPFAEYMDALQFGEHNGDHEWCVARLHADEDPTDIVDDHSAPDPSNRP